MPFMRDNFSLDYASSGLLLSVFSITYGLSQLPSGWLADRLGTRTLMAIGICGVGLDRTFTPVQEPLFHRFPQPLEFRR
jgi:sugar phosphate permease